MAFWLWSSVAVCGSRAGRVSSQCLALDPRVLRSSAVLPSPPCSRASLPSCLARATDDDDADEKLSDRQVLERLLAVDDKPERLIAAMGHSIDRILDPGLARLLRAEIDAEADKTDRRQRLERLFEAVVDFAEEVAANLASVDLMIQEDTTTAEALEKAIGEAAAPASRDEETQPQRAGRSSSRLPPLSDGDGPGQAERIARARNRFKLEKLLDAAHDSAPDLERTLAEMNAELDAAFFSHLQWEVEQQIDKKNRKVLELLELVIQRACAQVESSVDEARIFSELLYLESPQDREEMYLQRLAHADPSTRARFAQAVVTTQLELEKAVMQGQSIDFTLLQKVRCIGVEMRPYIDGVAGSAAVRDDGAAGYFDV